MDTKVKLCGLIMILGGLLIGLANTPDGPNIGLFVLGAILVAGPIFYLGESKKS